MKSKLIQAALEPLLAIESRYADARGPEDVRTRDEAKKARVAVERINGIHVEGGYSLNAPDDAAEYVNPDGNCYQWSDEHLVYRHVPFQELKFFRNASGALQQVQDAEIKKLRQTVSSLMVAAAGMVKAFDDKDEEHKASCLGRMREILFPPNPARRAEEIEKAARNKP